VRWISERTEGQRSREGPARLVQRLGGRIPDNREKYRGGERYFNTIIPVIARADLTLGGTVPISSYGAPSINRSTRKVGPGAWSPGPDGLPEFAEAG
jgi:hypothetical protein